MTVTMNLDEFLNTLNQLIESANGCLQDPKSFLAVNAEIGELIEAVLPALSEMFGQDEPDPEIAPDLPTACPLSGTSRRKPMQDLPGPAILKTICATPLLANGSRSTGR